MLSTTPSLSKMSTFTLVGIFHPNHQSLSYSFDVAQRISAVVEANQPVDNYWMRAPPTGGAAGAAGNPNCKPFHCST